MFSEAEISIDGEISLSVCLWNVNNLTLTFSKAVSPAERTGEPHTEAPNHPQLGQQVSTPLYRGQQLVVINLWQCVISPQSADS